MLFQGKVHGLHLLGSGLACHIWVNNWVDGVANLLNITFWIGGMPFAT